MSEPHFRVRELVSRLGLVPHPEGGWYRETFRSELSVEPFDGRPPRSALTGIYFLLAAGQHSAWHVVDSDEIWTHLEGEPVRLWTFDPSTNALVSTLLGPLSAEGAEPQRSVRAGIWQAAEPTGAFGFGACFVGPGFDFADFRLLDVAPDVRATLARLAPELLRLE